MRPNLISHRFKVEPRLRSFARLITQNFDLVVEFHGEEAFITAEKMVIPPVENTPEAFSRAKYFVAHECGHSLFSELNLIKAAAKEDRRLPHILNALEESRIENLMVRRFEGLETDFSQNIQSIISSWDVSQMPLAQQLLHGLFLVGRGYDVSFFCDDAQRLLKEFSTLILKAAEAPDTTTVLSIAREVLKRIEDILQDVPKRQGQGGLLSKKAKQELLQADFNLPSISEQIESHFSEVKLDPNYDDMEGKEYLKDENYPEKQSTEIPEEGTLSDYLRLLKPLQNELNVLEKELQNLVDKKRTQQRRQAFVSNQTTGVVESRRLWRLATHRDDVFKRRQRYVAPAETTDPDSLAVYILLDESYSMNDFGRIGYAQKAVIILAEALHRLRIRFAVTGYTVRGYLKRILYKQFDEDFRDVRTRLLQIHPRDGTYTQEHIPFALRRLLMRQERRKLLLVITDATEVESFVRFKEAVMDVKEASVELIGIGVQTNLMANYFDRYVEIRGLGGFARVLLALLKQVLRG